MQKASTTVKTQKERLGKKNLKLYCTTLYHRSNGLTPQLLANSTIGSRDKKKKKTRTMISEGQDTVMSQCPD